MASRLARASAAAIPLLVALVASALPACDGGEPAASPEIAADPGEDVDEGAAAVVPLTEPDETATSTRPAAPLDRAATDMIDVRGVGDAAWSRTHEETPIAAEYGAALDRFDPSGTGYRGDLSFINWETVVGTGCTQFASTYQPGRSYAFVSRPENLVQANERGFDLIGLSNNHARDCLSGPGARSVGEAASGEMTAAGIEGLGDRDWLVGGIASSADARDMARARVRTFTIKGREVRVAFGSLYTGRNQCPRAACRADADALFASLRDAKADLRIVAMHSMAAADQDDLVELGRRFVRDFRGDIVFGHGPHVWKPVRVVEKRDGGKGVIFESLGNFLHPGLAAQTRNIVGRALFDAETFELRQVQALPIANAGTEIRWSSVNGAELQANVRWSPATRGVFANVAP